MRYTPLENQRAFQIRIPSCESGCSGRFGCSQIGAGGNNSWHPGDDGQNFGRAAEPQRARYRSGDTRCHPGRGPEIRTARSTQADGFWLVIAKVSGIGCLIITSPTDRGVLYGVFAFLSKVARGEDISSLNEGQQPYAKIRWVDQWDNLNGTIERGYAGPSIFFEKGSVRADLTRASEYARLLASIGINGCTINNVNADPRLIDDNFLPQLARIADAFRPWGVQLAVSIDLSSPKTSGNLESFDPLDPRVVAWWQAKVDKIYRLIPDFGGFVVKADSEGRRGSIILRPDAR